MVERQAIRIIVAYDEARVIGHEGRIPWHLVEDRRHFVDLTAGCPVIMGRRTYYSLRPTTHPFDPLLPGRRKIVLTTSDCFLRYGIVTGTLDEALAEAHSAARPVWIIGGERVYREALAAGVVDEVVASEVAGVHEGDRHFPALGPGWREASREARAGFSLTRYVREGAARG